jgi:hypothetical protein
MVQIPVGDSTKFITFTAVGFGTNYATGYPTFSTTDVAVQEALEESEQFKSGKIILENAPAKIKDIEKKDNGTSDTATYPEVTTYQEAKELLRKEPYNIPFQSLGTPEKIVTKAAELGVSFPNLKAE